MENCFLRASAYFMDIPPPSAMVPFQDHVYSSPLHPTPPHSSVERVIKERDLLLAVQASLTKGRWSLQLLTPDNDYFKGRERVRIIKWLLPCLYSLPQHHLSGSPSNHRLLPPVLPG